jgi:hypothetical protein
MKPYDPDKVKDILKNIKPDASMAMEALKKANDTISMLINQLKTAETRWNEIFIVAATILNKFDKKLVLTVEDMVALSPQDYQITVDSEGDDRIIRLRHVTYKKDA